MGCALLVAACGGGALESARQGGPEPRPGAPVAVGKMGNPPLSGRRFDSVTPRLEFVSSGGECVRTALPEAGLTAVTATYPSVREGSSAVTLVVDTAGRVLRYIENRGGLRSLAPGETPRSAPADADEPRVTIQVDYETGQALVVNRGGGMPDELIVGTEADLERAPRLGNVASRSRAVLELCEGRRNAPGPRYAPMGDR